MLRVLGFGFAQPREEFGCARLADGRIAVCGGSGDAVLETKDNNITTSYSVKEGEEKTITTNVPTTTRRLAGLASYKVRLRLLICRSHASRSGSCLWHQVNTGSQQRSERGLRNEVDKDGKALKKKREHTIYTPDGGERILLSAHPAAHCQAA